MAHDVFLSHSSRDKAAADAACSVLERNGIRVWMAPRDIMPGIGWAKSIIGGIAGAKVMVLMFSSHANTSPQVEREVERAINKSIPIVFFRVEDARPDLAAKVIGDGVAPPPGPAEEAAPAEDCHACEPSVPSPLLPDSSSSKEPDEPDKTGGSGGLASRRRVVVAGLGLAGFGAIALVLRPAQAFRTLAGHIGAVYAVAFSPDGRTLASESRTARLSCGRVG